MILRLQYCNVLIIKLRYQNIEQSILRTKVFFLNKNYSNMPNAKFACAKSFERPPYEVTMLCKKNLNLHLSLPPLL